LSAFSERCVLEGHYFSVWEWSGVLQAAFLLGAVRGPPLASNT